MAGGEAGTFCIGIAPLSVGFHMFGTGDVDFMYSPEIRGKYWLTDTIAIQPSIMGGIMHSRVKLENFEHYFGDANEAVDSYFFGGSLAGLYYLGKGALRPYVGISFGGLMSASDDKTPIDHGDGHSSYKWWIHGYEKLQNSSTHLLSALLFGAEYFFNESFSIGGEIHVEFDYGWEERKEIKRYTHIEETSGRIETTRINEANKDKRDFHQINSNTLLILNYYF